MTRPLDEPPHPPGWELLASWVAVVETGSISEAARRLAISQAGVSQHIKQLELQFSTALLDRGTRPARPTASGHRLYEHATDLLRRAGDMSESVRLLSRAKRSIVRLACVDSFAATIGPALVRGLTGTMHKVRLSSGLSPYLNDQFLNRQVDLLVTTSDLAGEAMVQQIPMLTEQYCVVLPAQWRIERPGSLGDLSRGGLQMMCYSARSVLGNHIESTLRSTDPGIERAFEFDATDPLLSLVSAGLGFAITTPLCIWQSRHFVPELRILPLSAFSRGGEPYAPLARTFSLACREGELGSLPHEVHNIIRVAGRDIAARIVVKLGLARDAIVIHDRSR